MRNSNLIISISAAAFLAGCASTPDDFAESPDTDSEIAAVAATPPPPPPPPLPVASAPPPPVMAAPSPSNEVMVTAQKRTGNVSASVASMTSIDAARVRPSYVPPVYVATDPGRSGMTARKSRR